MMRLKPKAHFGKVLLSKKNKTTTETTPKRAEGVLKTVSVIPKIFTKGKRI